MKNSIGVIDKADASMTAKKNLGENIGVRGHYKFDAYDKNGQHLWTEKISNLITNEGKDDLLTNYLKGSAYTAGFHMGLTDGTPTPAAGDTMASHAGWVEVTAYSEATRDAVTLGSVASQSVDNSASKATFTINSDTTVIGGAFIGTDNTKGGTTGTLLSISAFSGGDKSLDTDDVLNVTVTFTS